jgi:general secretion pathway protein A
VYLEHWGLKRSPFGSAPDTRFFFHSATHDSALAELLYAVDESRGAALLVGPFGSGKTLVLRALLDGLPKDRFAVGRVRNALMRPAEVVLSCARALGAAELPEDAASVSESFAQARLEGRLEAVGASGRRAVLAVDDAHVITGPAVWEALRLVLCSAAGANSSAALIMTGAADLLDLSESVPGFSERVAVRSALSALTREETLDYILHRLDRAGASSGIFTREAAMEIARRSEGVPGKINRLADLALAAGSGMGMSAVGPDLVRMVAEESGGRGARENGEDAG